MLARNMQRFLALDPEERRLFLKAWVLLAVVSLGLHVVGFQRCQRWLSCLTEDPTDGRCSSVPRFTQRVVRMVRLAASHSIGHPTCLPQSLVCWWLFRRHGIESELRIGTRRYEGKFEAHAWVERQGEVLNDRPDVHERFTPFAQPISPSMFRPDG